MKSEYETIVAGMTGKQFIEAINGNSNKSKLQFEEILQSIAKLVLGNNVKQVKVEEGKFLYTTDGTNWSTVDNNVWGSITGNIEDQNDLKEALNSKASNKSVEDINKSVSSLSTKVTSVDESVKKNTSSISENKKSIGEIQNKQSKQVSSETILSLRISSSGFLQYSLDNVAWVNVQSVADINWGSIGGEISNQVDLQELLKSKAPASSLTNHTGNKENPHNVTKSQIGLSNVDNTSDKEKPISDAQKEKFDAIDNDIKEIKNNKLNVTNDIKAIEYISLENWNIKKEAGELSETTIYIVD